jgi:hypothetical protein
MTPGGPQGLNRYSYGLNNPVKNNDPTGHWPNSLKDYLLITWNNLMQARSIVLSSQATVGQRLGAATYIGVFSVATAAAIAPVIVAGPKAISEAFGGNVQEPGLPDNITIDSSSGGEEPPDYQISEPGSTGQYTSPHGFPTDPTSPPADGFEWRGKQGSVPGDRNGNYYNPDTQEWFHWESDSPSHGTHWDYSDQWERRYRIYPDGSMDPKK